MSQEPPPPGGWQPQPEGQYPPAPGAQYPPQPAQYPPHPHSQPPPPGAWEPSPAGMPQNAAPEERTNRRGLVIAVVAVLLLAVVGVGAVLAQRFLNGSSDRLAELTPDDAVLYAHLNLNPSGSNKMGFRNLVNRINDAAGEELINFDAVLDDLDEELGEGMSFSDDIDPWLGDQVAVFLSRFPENPSQEGDVILPTVPDFAVMLTLEDPDAAAAFIEDQDIVGEWDAGDDRQGWVLSAEFGGSAEGVAAIDDDILLAGTVAAVEDALDGGDGLAGVDAYTSVIDELPDRVVTVWANTPEILESLGDLALGTQDALQQGGPAALSIGFAESSIEFVAVSQPPSDDEGDDDEPVASALLEELPAGGLLYARLPDFGRTVADGLDAIDSALLGQGGQFGQTVDPSQLPSAQVDSALQQLAGTSLGAIAEWLGDLTLVLGYDPSQAEDNALLELAFAVSDEDEAADLVDALAGALPPDLGLTIDPGSISAGDASLNVDDGRLALRVGSGGDGSLADDEAFQGAIEGLEGDPVFYLDVRSLVEAIAPFTAGAGDPDTIQQALDIAGAFDSMVATADTRELTNATLRISFGSDLEPVDASGEPNPPDLDFGPFGTFEELLNGGSGGSLGGMIPTDPAIPTPEATPEVGAAPPDTGAQDVAAVIPDDPFVEPGTAQDSGLPGVVDGRPVACGAEEPANAGATRPIYPGGPAAVLEPGVDYLAVIQTSCGTLTFDLLEDDAPVTVNSFVFLAQQGFFDGLEIFRNAASIGALQTGGGDQTNGWRIGYSLPDELGLAQSGGYPVGAVAMANAGPDTGGSQFFFVYNSLFDTAFEGAEFYAVFGQVVEGLAVLEAIGAIPVDGETPTERVYMEAVTIEQG